MPFKQDGVYVSGTRCVRRISISPDSQQKEEGTHREHSQKLHNGQYIRGRGGKYHKPCYAVDTNR